MIKSKKEMMIINAIGFISGGVSYAFTIFMLMNFAETLTDKILYCLCGIMIDGTKWFALITLIKYYRAKLYKNFLGYCLLFICFFGMSLTASISYSIYMVQNQMYDVEKVENSEYTSTKEAVEKVKTDIETLEGEKANELSRINTELDGLPLDYITRRKELADKKIELTTFYDGKLSTLNTDLDEKTTTLNQLDSKPQEIKTLKQNSLTGFFNTLANVSNVKIDNIIMTFGVALGAILDIASIALTFDKSFSYHNKRSFNKDMTNYRNIRVMNNSLKSRNDDEDDEPRTGTGGKIVSYEEFKKFIRLNGLNINEISFLDVQNFIAKSTFYKFKGQMEAEEMTGAIEA